MAYLDLNGFAYFSGRKPFAFAHRGGARLPENQGIENTLTAFAHAVALGYRYLETDVHVSKDGVVYAFHDEHLGRLTKSDALIAELSAAEIDDLELARGEKIPRLEEVLSRFPEANFNIDVKTDEAVEPTLDVLTRAQALSRVCLASFSHARLRRIRKLAPQVPTSASVREIVLMRLFNRRPAALCLQVPHRRGPIPVASAGFVRRAHKAGLQVHVWTIDDAAEMAHLLDLGVDGIMTDRPDVLKAVLVDREEWHDN